MGPVSVSVRFDGSLNLSGLAPFFLAEGNEHYRCQLPGRAEQRPPPVIDIEKCVALNLGIGFSFRSTFQIGIADKYSIFFLHQRRRRTDSWAEIAGNKKEETERTFEFENKFLSLLRRRSSSAKYVETEIVESLENNTRASARARPPCQLITSDPWPTILGGAGNRQAIISWRLSLFVNVK